MLGDANSGNTNAVATALANGANSMLTLAAHQSHTQLVVNAAPLPDISATSAHHTAPSNAYVNGGVVCKMHAHDL